MGVSGFFAIDGDSGIFSILERCPDFRLWFNRNTNTISGRCVTEKFSDLDNNDFDTTRVSD